MSKNKKLNRDHAKKTQCPMVEDEVIANQLEALLIRLNHFLRKLGSAKEVMI